MKIETYKMGGLFAGKGKRKFEVNGSGFEIISLVPELLYGWVMHLKIQISILVFYYKKPERVDWEYHKKQKQIVYIPTNFNITNCFFPDELFLGKMSAFC